MRTIMRLGKQYMERYYAYLSRIRYIVRSYSFEASGKGGVIGRRVRISSQLRLAVGERCALRDGVILAGCGSLEIGDMTCVNDHSIVTSLKSVKIGANVMIAPRVYILDVDHQFASRAVPMSEQGYCTQPVVIEDDVWLGAGVVVTKGVHIGRGSIVGANSVVTRDIPPFVISAGVPARVLKDRPL